jgi:hypothetical protein
MVRDTTRSSNRTAALLLHWHSDSCSLYASAATFDSWLLRALSCFCQTYPASAHPHPLLLLSCRCQLQL